MGYTAFENPFKAGRFASLMLGSSALLERAADSATHRAALYLVKQTKRGIDRQAPGGKRFKPLHPMTKAKKGSSKALMDRRDMYRSIKAVKVESAAYLAGVHRNVKSKSGGPMVSIAWVHENGYDPKKHGGRGKWVIPARPFMEPTIRKEEKKLVQMVGEGTAKKFFAGVF